MSHRAAINSERRSWTAGTSPAVILVLVQGKGDMRKRMIAVAAWGLVAMCTSAVALARDTVPPDSPLPTTRPEGGVPIAVEIREPPRSGTVPPGPTYRVSARNLSGRAIVAWGVRVYARDREARLRPLATFVIRPRAASRPAIAVGWLDGPTVPGPSPAYEARPTFAVFEDGRGVGDGGLVRREVAALREEYRAARMIGELLAAVPATPTRPNLVETTVQLSRGLAMASSPAARGLYESVLTTLAAAIDLHTRGDRTLAQMVNVARDTVDRRLGSFERLSFIVADAKRP